jgi:DNA-binding NarL/FixJ family response regulator
VDVLLELGELEAAHQAAGKLAELAQQTSSALLLAQAELAEGQVRRISGDPQAGSYFQAAIDRLQAYEQSLMSSRARLEMARLLSASDRPAAITWARAALASFERLGASQDAGQAAHLLQQFGVSRRGGPRLKSPLTKREAEILGLIAQGLTNREIASRLVVSPKTVEHHVGQILSKLGARSRAEAAAYAVRYPASELPGSDNP